MPAALHHYRVILREARKLPTPGFRAAVARTFREGAAATDADAASLRRRASDLAVLLVNVAEQKRCAAAATPGKPRSLRRLIIRLRALDAGVDGEDDAVCAASPLCFVLFEERKRARVGRSGWPRRARGSSSRNLTTSRPRRRRTYRSIGRPSEPVGARRRPSLRFADAALRFDFARSSGRGLRPYSRAMSPRAWCPSCRFLALPDPAWLAAVPPGSFWGVKRLNMQVLIMRGSTADVFSSGALRGACSITHW